MNTKYKHIAVLGTVLEFVSMKELASDVARNLKDVEFYDHGSNGFVLRCKKDVDLSDEILTNALVDATSDILRENLEDASEYIMDTYDFAYEEADLSARAFEEVLEITRVGRLVYVEITDM